MVYTVIALLAVGALIFIAYPLVSRKRHLPDLEDMFDLGDTRQRRYLDGKKLSIIDNLKELDFEYEMGKLSEEDYGGLRDGYLKEAQETIQALDKLKVREEIEELIESEVRAKRRTE
ncbi:MAG: hypothetical protein ACE5EO_06845 [Candidatus Krumholzibacteriia bacterium]